MTSPAEWRLLSRPGCHLCDDFLNDLLPFLPATVTVQRCNVDSRDDWRLAFGRRIPVLLDASGRVLYAADSPTGAENIVKLANG